MLCVLTAFQWKRGSGYKLLYKFVLWLTILVLCFNIAICFVFWLLSRESVVVVTNYFFYFVLWLVLSSSSLSRKQLKVEGRRWVSEPNWILDSCTRNYCKRCWKCRVVLLVCGKTWQQNSFAENKFTKAFLTSLHAEMFWCFTKLLDTTFYVLVNVNKIFCLCKIQLHDIAHYLLLFSFIMILFSAFWAKHRETLHPLVATQTLLLS